jgi:predicted Rossmann fold flavoprotein
MKNKIAIIGGGASGLMLASLLPKNSAIVIESNSYLGAKLLVCGGGKCNITNTKLSTQYYRANSQFIEYALDMFDNNYVINYFKDRGLEVVIEKNGQYFCKNSAKDLVDILKKEASKQQIRLNTKVTKLTKQNDIFTIYTNQGDINASSVVVATGGISFAKLGASDIGYKIASDFGHHIIPTAPALVGLSLQKEQFFFKELSGISCDVVVSYQDYRFEGALLFAHRGISGPAILDISLFWDKGAISIDFLPGFDWSVLQGSNKILSNLLPLAKRITKAFLIQFGLNDKVASKYTTKEVEILKQLNHYSFAPAGTFGYSKAEVTKGGVDCSEIDAYTMQSKKCQGLYFLGEVLDVTGIVGGYNLQWAFSSANVCRYNLTGSIK